MKAIINTKLVMEDGIIWDGVLIYENGRIVDAGWAHDVTVPDGAEVIDANGLYTAPGLIDIHCHGNGTNWFQDDPIGCAEYFVKHGVTTVLPTFYHGTSKQEMIDGAKRIREASLNGIGRIMDGLYMEGPFMALSGSMQSLLKWDGDIEESQYCPLVDSFGDMVRVWAIDPHRKNIEQFMQYVRETTPNVIFAHGHSSATAEEIQALAHYGVKVRTHITDADSAPGRAQGTPGAGGDEYCLYEPDMYAELICDEMGIHVPPGLIKMIVRTKGYEKICLISDHSVQLGNYTANKEAGVWYGPDLNYDDMGYLAGSLMTLENGVRNLMTHTGYGLCHSIRMATLNPAKLLGIDYRVGSLRPGKTANLILIDDMVHTGSRTFHSAFYQGGNAPTAPPSGLNAGGLANTEVWRLKSVTWDALLFALACPLMILMAQGCDLWYTTCKGGDSLMSSVVQKRIAAVKTADAINAMEGAPISTYARTLSTSWARGELTGQQMKKALLDHHRRIAEQERQSRG